MNSDDFENTVTAVAALADPTRLALYRFVAGQEQPVGREEAATAVGIPHHAARFHLDRLHDSGLLEVEYRRPPGRGGPGAGHPTKLYKPATGEFAVSLPDRRYDVAGLVLARAVTLALAEEVSIADALLWAAGDAGRAIGRAARAPAGSGPDRQPDPLGTALSALDSFGFNPRAVDGGYVLANCPFKSLATQATEVVCGMNRALIAAVLEECGGEPSSAELDPAEDRCCVTVRA